MSAVAARIPTLLLGKCPAVNPARTTSTSRFKICGEQRMVLLAGLRAVPKRRTRWYHPASARTRWQRPSPGSAGSGAARMNDEAKPMTEYEVATLAFQQSTLAFQEATLAVRRIGLWIAAAHVAVGLLQAAIVWYGIRTMQRATERRADEASRLAAADERRHDEAMTALRALIARTAPAAD